MPKKLLEQPHIFNTLLAETHAAEQAVDPAATPFAVKTDDPTCKSFADDLINEHYPAQSELPLA